MDYDCGVDPPIEDQVVEIVDTPILDDPGYLVVDSAYRQFVAQGGPRGPGGHGISAQMFNQLWSTYCSTSK